MVFLSPFNFVFVFYLYQLVNLKMVNLKASPLIEVENLMIIIMINHFKKSELKKCSLF